MAILPESFTVRPAALDDAQRVTDMLIATDIADYGEPDTSIQDVLASWRRDNFMLDRDTWLIFAADGNLAACGIMWDTVHRARVEPSTNIHPDYRGRGLEEFQADRVEEWARRYASVKTVQWITLATQPDGVALLERRGYKPVRFDYVMEITMDEPPPKPVIGEGFTLRSFEMGHDERAVHACLQEAFRDARGHTGDQAFESWWSGYGEHQDWSSDLSCVVTQGDEVIAAAMAFHFDNGGWIRQLGVLRPWRKHGIGLAMLHKIFGDFYGRGVKNVGLGVDASSPTGATRLYERAGMKIKNQYARYEKDVSL